MSGFRKFLMRGNLIDLAVAVVIGVAFNAIVQALVTDVITPLISAAGGSKVNFASLKVTIGHSVIAYGLVLNSLLSFVIIAAVVYYLIVAPSARMASRTGCSPQMIRPLTGRSRRSSECHGRAGLGGDLASGARGIGRVPDGTLEIALQ